MLFLETDAILRNSRTMLVGDCPLGGNGSCRPCLMYANMFDFCDVTRINRTQLKNEGWIHHLAGENTTAQRTTMNLLKNTYNGGRRTTISVLSMN